MRRQLIPTILFLALSIGNAFGWGSGHDDQARLMFEMLPNEIQKILTEEQRHELIRHYSHFPDSGGEITAEKIGETGHAFAVGHHLEGVYGFHGSKGKATAFVLLTRAFAENDPDLAALWMGTLVHSIGDEAACNHDPLISYLTYAFKAYGIPMGQGVGLDYSDVAKTEEGRAIVAALAEKFEPSIVSENPEETLLYLMMSEAEGNAFMTSRGAAIAAAYKPGASEQKVNEARRALAELGQYGAERAANVVLTAWHYAKQGKAATLDFDEALLKRAEEAERAFIAARSLSSDSIFAGLLDGSPAGPAVGVLIEPSQKMNRCYLGFSSKYISAAAMRVMKENGIPWRALDLRRMNPENPPSTTDTPVMMVCSGSARLPEAAMDALRAYTEEGGKLLWIGGRDRGLLGELSESLSSVDEANLPVLRKYGAGNEETISKASILFEGPLADALGAEPLPFIRNPNTKAGWHKPYCPYQIDVTRPNLKPLAILKVGEKTFPVGAALRDPGKSTHVFIPEYLVAPFLLTPASELQDVSKPLFDPVGSKVLLACLGALDPSLTGNISPGDEVPVSQAKERDPVTRVCDVAVFGATPSGIAAAIAAKRAGVPQVTLADPSSHVGGRFAEAIGFGEIQRMKPESVGGLWSELRAKVDAHYGEPTQNPEPHVLEQLLGQWLEDEGVVFADRFQPVRADKAGGHLVRVYADRGDRIEASVFVDASYYGDLLPVAGVGFTIGRESRAQYDESLAGVLLKLVDPPGPIDIPVKRSPVSGFAADGKTLLPHVHGLTTDVREGEGDTHLQCANLYACFSRDPANRVELSEPANYDPAEFELLRREIVRLGEAFRVGFGGGGPAGKARMNDGVGFLLHWGLAGGADDYPTATPQERRQIWETHRGYTHRLLWFLRTDASVPEPIRENLQQWGLPKDEFTDNGHWPYDLYAREGRRLLGDFVMTQRDLFEDTVKPDAIALGSFPVDSHVVRRLATPDGKEVINEGGFLVIPPIYEVPYRALTPKAAECDNLLVTCALGSSRVAFNSLRVEPTWMMLGQAAGTAAAMAQQDDTPVQRVKVPELQRRLQEVGVPFKKP